MASYTPKFGFSSKCGWVASNQNKYERFKNTLVHGEDWGTGLKYFAMYWIHVHHHGGDKPLYSPMFENEQYTHAETKLLEHLSLQWSAMTKPASIKSLTIMQNASPCNRCSQQYQQHLGPIAQQVPVTVIFSSFYNVRRPSCAREGHSHLNEIQENHSRDNVKELKKLKAANIYLTTTCYADWICLRKALQLPNTYNDEAYKLSARKREDDALMEDLRILMK